MSITDQSPAPRPEDVIKLDRTRTRFAPGPGIGQRVHIPDYSEVHGDRRDEDPHVNVRFFQDGLPFDNNGRLVPDDGRIASWTETFEGADGKLVTIRYKPLYDDVMRAKVARKMARLLANRRIMEQVPSAEDIAEDIEERLEASDDVNIADWLTGNAEYQPHMVYAAIKKRWGRSVASIKQAVKFLVEEEHVVHAGTLQHDFKKHLKDAA